MGFASKITLAGLVLAYSAEPAVRGQVQFGPAGFGTAYSSHAVSTGPFGGVSTSDFYATSRSGPGGVAVQHVGGSSVLGGPFGGVGFGSASATRVIGPGGGSYMYSQSGSARFGAYGGVAVAAAPLGGATAYGGYAAGPYGALRAETVATESGYAPLAGAVPVDSHTEVSNDPYGGVRTDTSTKYLSPNSLRAMSRAARSPYYAAYTTTEYQEHTTHVQGTRLVTAGVWVAPAWSSLATYCGITAAPIAYDYGSTSVIQSNHVYVNGEQVGTAADYATQAQQMVDAGRQAAPAENEQWQPLGVFGLMQESDTVPQRIFQFEVNKDGIIRGNYYDALSDTTTPLAGSVDKQSQRVGWSIGNKKGVIFEAGLSNFTKDEMTILVHYGKDATQQRVLVRLEDPKNPKHGG